MVAPTTAMTKPCRDGDCARCPNPDNCEHVCHDLDWEDPPAKASRDGGFPAEVADKVAALKARPGKWARLATFKGEPKKGAVRCQPLRKCYPHHEFTARSFPDGSGTSSAVWGRYTNGQGSKS